MTRRLTALIAACVCVLAWSGSARAGSEPPNVVASIQPVHSLVAAVMAGVGEPTLLIGGGASPHTASLRPSQAAALQRADVVFWIGESLETFLARPLAALPGHARVVALADAPGVTLLPARRGGIWVAPDHAHAGDSDDGHGHADGGDDAGTRVDRSATDMHIWLDPINAKAMAEAIVAALAQADPDHAGRYRTNGAALREKIDDLDRALRAELSAAAGRPYIVFHDAYHYFEARYGLTPAGSMTVHPDRSPGAATLSAVRARIADAGAACVFREPQFEPALVRTVTQGTGARLAVLDPLGTDIAPGPEAYFTLMHRLAAALRDCLVAGD